MRVKPNPTALSDDQLLRRLSELLRSSRRVEADLVAHIAEVDARKLYAREAAHSMFAYCTEVLHLSESEAYLRIAVARASRRHPVLLAMLADGRQHLTGIERLAPHLTDENRDALLGRAVHMSKRQVEELVAELVPRPPAPAVVRKLPARRGPDANGGPGASSELYPARVAATHEDPAGGLGASVTGVADRQGPDVAGLRGELRPAGVIGQDGHPDREDGLELRPAGVGARPMPPRTPTAAIEAVGSARYRVRFDASAELRDKLERLQALTRSSVPDGDLGKVIDLAVTRELERLEAKRFAKTKRPRQSLAETDTRPKSRHIPAAVRRAVHERDGGRCTYRDKHGRRCTKRHNLEFHHRKPFARGGEHSPEVLCLMCRTHNTLAAEQDYGKEVMARYRRSWSASRVSEPVAVYGAGAPARPRGCPPG